jgi:DNA-binding MarR family transcriptional regulator
MQRTYAPLLKPYGLTYAQYLALLVLWEGDDIPVGEVGRRLHLDSGTVTPLLKRLAALGYVTRRRSAADEREVRIALTPQGTALRSEMGRTQHQVACASALEPDEFTALRERLRRLRADLHAAIG